MDLQTLKNLESIQNNGRGVSCVRDIIFHFERGELYRSRVAANTDHDWIRNYPELEIAVRDLLWPDGDFNSWWPIKKYISSNKQVPPPNWSTWGPLDFSTFGNDLGDGLWRAGQNTPHRNDTQKNQIFPQKTQALAIEEAWKVWAVMNSNAVDVVAEAIYVNYNMLNNIYGTTPYHEKDADYKQVWKDLAIAAIHAMEMTKA